MSSSDILEIPYSLEGLTEDEIYEVQIQNIYDLSKLWIIVNFKELKLFMSYLDKYYRDEENRIKVPSFKLKRNLTCVIERNTSYYRAIILPLLLPENNEVKVFLVDYGFFVKVDVKNIFYILEKHAKVPRFAIRACLINVIPAGVHTLTWKNEHVKLFLQLISDKKLYAKIEAIDSINKILFIELYVHDTSKSANIMEPLSLLLVRAKIAEFAIFPIRKTPLLSKYVPVVKYPHLLPCIESIEEGRVPTSMWEYNLVKEFIPFDILMQGYKYQDINSQL